MGFRGPPIPAGQGLCGFNKRWEVGHENQFFRYNFANDGLAKLLIIYMTARDHPRSRPHGPGPTGVGGP